MKVVTEVIGITFARAELKVIQRALDIYANTDEVDTKEEQMQIDAERLSKAIKGQLGGEQ